MFDELFEGSPEKKCFDIIFGANQSVVSAELGAIFDELCALRVLASRAGVSEDEIKSLANSTELADEKNDFYITLVSDILSKNE